MIRTGWFYAVLILTLGTPIFSSAAPASWGNEPWAKTRGIYTFVLSVYKPPWGNHDWTLEQWRRYIDFLAFVGINHLQLMRAPWSERPAETPQEREKEELWREVFAYAKSKGMTTSVILSTTFHGSPSHPWHILSPGNPSHPHWKTLVKDYEYFARRYSDVVDEWHWGVEDPGGCPKCSGSAWADFTPTAECNPASPCCTVKDMIGLMLEGRRLCRQYNPHAVTVAHTWAVVRGHWWAHDPEYSSALDEFLALIKETPADIRVGTHGMDDELTDRLQAATSRELIAWPFYLFDHEFTAGMTRIYFEWMHTHLKNIRAQGLTTVIAHTTHPVFMMPAIYVYAGWLYDTERPEMELLDEFAGYLVTEPEDRKQLATAIYELAEFWNTMIGVANWDEDALKPIEPSPPYAERYSEETLAHIDAAREAIRKVKSIRTESEMPMVVTPEQWVKMLTTQIEIIWSFAHFDRFLDAKAAAKAVCEKIGALKEPVSRSAAERLIKQLGDGRFLARERLDTALQYQLQYWPSPTQWESPLGLIYSYLRSVALRSRIFEKDTLRIEGDLLVFVPPVGPPLRKKLAD